MLRPVHVVGAALSLKGRAVSSHKGEGKCLPFTRTHNRSGGTDKPGSQGGGCGASPSSGAAVPRGCVGAQAPDAGPSPAPGWLYGPLPPPPHQEAHPLGPHQDQAGHWPWDEGNRPLSACDYTPFTSALGATSTVMRRGWCGGHKGQPVCRPGQCLPWAAWPRTGRPGQAWGGPHPPPSWCLGTSSTCLLPGTHFLLAGFAAPSVSAQFLLLLPPLTGPSQAG